MSNLLNRVAFVSVIALVAAGCGGGGGGGDELEQPPVDPVVNTDYDNDGIVDVNDNCEHGANADQADGDNDGVGDACEVEATTDTDQDGSVDARDNCPSLPILTRKILILMILATPVTQTCH